MWTYDPTDLGTDTVSGRLNSVRLLVGDTDTSDQQLQNSEIEFALTQNTDNVYNAASWLCGILVAKYSRMVDTQLDGALEGKYSNRVAQYGKLAVQLAEMGRRSGGLSLGVSGGGISISAMESAASNTDRPKSRFYVGQFDNPMPPVDYLDV